MAKERGSPFGEAIRRARGTRSVRGLATAAGISEGRWRQIEMGFTAGGKDESGNDVRIPANPKADTAIAMARVVGLDEGEALSLAGYDPADYVTSLASAQDPRDARGFPTDGRRRLGPGLGSLIPAGTDGASVRAQQLSDDELLDELARRLTERERERKAAIAAILRVGSLGAAGDSDAPAESRTERLARSVAARRRTDPG